MFKCYLAGPETFPFIFGLIIPCSCLTSILLVFQTTSSPASYTIYTGAVIPYTVPIVCHLQTSREFIDGNHCVQQHAPTNATMLNQKHRTDRFVDYADFVRYSGGRGVRGGDGDGVRGGGGGDVKKDVPNSIDWRTSGIVAHVKDQVNMSALKVGLTPPPPPPPAHATTHKHTHKYMHTHTYTHRHTHTHTSSVVEAATPSRQWDRWKVCTHWRIVLWSHSVSKILLTAQVSDVDKL